METVGGYDKSHPALRAGTHGETESEAAKEILGIRVDLYDLAQEQKRAAGAIHETMLSIDKVFEEDSQNPAIGTRLKPFLDKEAELLAKVDQSQQQIKAHLERIKVLGVSVT